MSAFPTSANLTSFVNSTSWRGSSNSTNFGNSTAWITSSHDTNSSWGPTDWVSIYASHVGAKRLAISFLTWVAYDVAITIDDSVGYLFFYAKALPEINLFWKYRWSFSKAMYLISRYDSLFTVGAIAAQIYVENPSLSVRNLQSSRRCLLRVPFIGMTTIALHGGSMDRTRRRDHINNNNNQLGNDNSSICTLGPGHTDPDILLVWIFTQHRILRHPSVIFICKRFYLRQYPAVHWMHHRAGSDKLWIIFITSIGFETMIVCLTVYKAWSVAIQRGIRTPLYTLILQDSVVYFIIIILSQVLTIAALYIPSIITGPIAGSLPSIAVSGIACNRLFTHLQRLLLDKSKAQSSFPTEDFATSSSPQTSYDVGIIKQRTSSPRSRPQSPQDTLQRRRSSLGTRISKHLRSGGGVGSDDIVMEKVPRTSTQNRDSGIRGRLERSSWRGDTQRHDDRRTSGSLDEEIDLSGHYQATEAVRKSHDILEHHKSPREGEVEVEVKQSAAVETRGDPRVDDDPLSSHENEGPFTSGSGKSVMDPSPRSPGELSNVPDGG